MTCMATTGKRVAKALNISIYFQTKHILHGNQSQSQAFSKSCELEFILPHPTARHSIPYSKNLYFRAHLVNQTCTQHNYILMSNRKGYNMYFQDNEYLFNRLYWTGCEPEYDPLPQYITSVKQIFVVIHVNSGNTDYSLQIDIAAGLPSTREMDMEILPLSSGIGLYFKKRLWHGLCICCELDI